MGKTSFLRCLLIGMVLLFFTPLTSADSNNLFFESTYNSELPGQGKRTLELGENGTLGYASFDNSLLKYSTNDKETILSRTFEQDILSTSLSPDGTRIALTLTEGGNALDTIYVLESDTFETKISSQSTGSNAMLLEWTDNGASLITNHPSSGIMKLNREDLSIEAEYNGNLSGVIVCADIAPSGSYVMAGDDTGRMVIWNSDGSYTHQEFLLDPSISDCSIDPTESMFTVSIDGNKIRKWTMTGSELRPLDTPGVQSFKWSSNGQYVYVHRSNEGQYLSIYDSSDASLISEVSLFHQFTEFEILEKSPGILDFAIFTSLTSHVVMYDSSHEKSGIGESGSDFDSDGIPNSIDDDDDGDGIEDIWDLNCDAPEGFSCELYPDETYMRSMDLTLNETLLEVKETFTLNKYDSSVVRNLNRYSLDLDVKLSKEEANLFADSYCTNIHEDNYSMSISNSILIEGAALDYLSMSCKIESGMELTQVDDTRTHVRYSITTSYNISGNISLGENAVKILYQPTPVQGSITVLSEQHPISVTVSGELFSTSSFTPWFLQEATISLDLIENIDSDEGAIVDTSLFTTWWFISLAIMSTAGVLFLLFKVIKQEDSYTIDLGEDDEFNDEVNEEEIEDMPFEEIIEVEDSSNQQPENETQKFKKKRTRSTSGKINQEKPAPTVRKRRARATNDDSTPVVSKRRRLVDSTPPVKVRKRRAVKQSMDIDDVEISDQLNRYGKN
tara:strand:- start:2885 stop:5077 length:2193 start_codon:yes stop_codon:yes gene_type:complete